MKFTLVLALSLFSLTYAWKSSVSSLIQMQEEDTPEEAAEQQKALDVVLARSAEYTPVFVVRPEDVDEDIINYQKLEFEVDGDEIVEIHGQWYKDEELEDKLEYYNKERAILQDTNTVMLVENGVKSYVPADSV